MHGLTFTLGAYQSFQTRVTSSELDLHLRLESLTEDAFQAENGARDTASNVGVLFVDSPSGLDDVSRKHKVGNKMLNIIMIDEGKDRPK